MRLPSDHYLKMALDVATTSRDHSTQVGVILVHPTSGRVLVAGCNDFPEGIEDRPERRTHPEKLLYTEHAERTAINNAARCGICTHDIWMYCSWAACEDCARGIIGAGISRVITHIADCQLEHQRWVDSTKRGIAMLREAGVDVEEVRGYMGRKIRFSGRETVV